MKEQIKRLFLFTFSYFTLTSIFAQNPPISTGAEFIGNPIQTAVPFLRVSPEAKAGGMGDVGVATSPDANSVHWNSAKIAFAKPENGVTLAYTPWLAGLGVDDVYMLAGGGYHKLDELSALNFGIKYFSLGEAIFRQSQFDSGILDNPQEFAIQGGYSRKLSDITGLGVNLKYINSDLATGQQSGGQTIKTGQAIAGDLNFYFDPLNSGKKADWAFGLSLSNLGSKISYLENDSEKDFLPTNLGLGANVDIATAETSKVSFALDANKLLVPTPADINDTSFREENVIGAMFTSWRDAPGGFSEELKEWQVSLGGEYNYDEKFYGRAGYFYENKEKGNRNYATLGAGLAWNATNFNFSYLFSTGDANSPLDKTLRFSVEFDF